jgi:hypothetical protein
MRIISKSKFVSGIQCEKKLFFDVHRKDLKPELSEQQIQLDVVTQAPCTGNLGSFSEVSSSRFAMTLGPGKLWARQPK